MAGRGAHLDLLEMLEEEEVLISFEFGASQVER